MPLEGDSGIQFAYVCFVVNLNVEYSFDLFCRLHLTDCFLFCFGVWFVIWVGDLCQWLVTVLV